MLNAADGSQPSRNRSDNCATGKDDISSMSNTSDLGREEPSEPRSRIRIPPNSRFRRRADGGVDDTYRVHFAGALNHEEMRRIMAALLAFLDESGGVGIVGLTKVEFPEPDVCEYRLWSLDFRSERLNVEFDLLYRLNQIHTIGDVDGIRYPLPRT